MKIFRTLSSVLWLLSSVLWLHAQPTPGTAAPASDEMSPADRDYAAWQAGKKVMYPANYREMSKAEKARWMDSTLQKLIADGVAYIEQHPSDPRRWDVVVYIGSLKPTFIKDIGPDFETIGAKAYVIDEPAKAAWQAKLKQLWQAMREAPDRTPIANEELDWGAFATDFRAEAAKAKGGQAVDWTAFHARFDAHAAKYPTMDAALVRRANDFLTALGQVAPEAAVAGWAQVAATATNGALQKMAAEHASQNAAISRPLEIKFTAADGRPVDLAQLRGKVVLIDFWATWCGPCKEELPNVVANYRKYHDQGFEVVGIALENAKLAPQDTPEQAAAKLAAARKVLTDFTAEHGMPWPQYFDGKFWKTEFATQYQITGIPAMFLVDQNGKVVSTNARGSKLEAEIKRLLKL